ncbi:MAG: helix-turn-helix domain-containing protein, partial [Gemmatimonadales bacterium]
IGGAVTDSAMSELIHCATFEEFKQTAERAYLQAKLEANGWNVSETARKLNMPRSNLYKKIEKYGIARR